MSASESAAELHRTPLHARHVEAGARMVPFAGFDMPVVYTSILDEHRAVRSRAGIFDVSHMGELR
ncbi:MAG: glycine cleavage system aminomethyltransferase GcvT, partial [Solirubrobacteraceae bacterium]